MPILMVKTVDDALSEGRVLPSKVFTESPQEPGLTPHNSGHLLDPRSLPVHRES